MREKYIEQRLRQEVRRRGGLCEKWVSGTAGWPDRIIIFPDGKVGSYFTVITQAWGESGMAGAWSVTASA